MRGELIAVWSETRREIWDPLSEVEAAPADLFPELYRALAPALKAPPTVEEVAEITANAALSRERFFAVTADEFAGERVLTECLESIGDELDNLAGDPLANPYFNLLTAFVEKFSLRYEVRRPCLLCPTLPGVFAKLTRELREAAGLDEHLTNLFQAFEESIRDLRGGITDARLKTCIQRHMNLLEAFGRACSNVTQKTLGAICHQLTMWPHQDVRNAVIYLYGFANDYPGIRHGGTPAHALRNLELRDLVAVSIALVGLTPYLTDLLNADRVYHGP